MSVQVAQLKSLLEQRFPSAVPVAYRATGALATGMATLDRVLPGNGLPRGRLVGWAAGGGATALLRATCQAVVRQGERTAWIDAAGWESSDSWSAGPLLLRPRGHAPALECAETLLHSGGFALVVLNGVEASDVERVRLSRAARAGGGALVAVTEATSHAAVRVTSRIAPADYRWRTDPFGEPAEVEWVTLHVRATALGWSREVMLKLRVVCHEPCLSVEPALGDRRGATR